MIVRQTSPGVVELVIVLTVAGFIWMTHKYKVTTYDDIFDKAARDIDADPNMLRAIAKVESNLNPDAISPLNKNGTRDYGLMQVNEKTGMTFGVTDTSQLLNPDTNVNIASQLLARIRTEL